MNYKEHYNKLIETRKDRILDENEYYEKHHIVPKSLGGSNDKENLVYLTAREHFVAHQLLYKMSSNTNERIKMVNAWNRMRFGNKSQNKKITSRQFELVRKTFAKEWSKKMSGKNHPCWGVRPPKEVREKVSKGLKKYFASMTKEERSKICGTVGSGKDNPSAINDNCYIVSPMGEYEFVEYLTEYVTQNKLKNVHTKRLRKTLTGEFEHHQGYKCVKTEKEAKEISKKIKEKYSGYPKEILNQKKKRHPNIKKDNCYVLTPTGEKIFVEYLIDFVKLYPELKLSTKRMRYIMNKDLHTRGFKLITEDI